MIGVAKKLVLARELIDHNFMAFAFYLYSRELLHLKGAGDQIMGCLA